MTINTTTNSQSYAGSGASPFNFPYKFFANSDLIVQRRINASGVISTLVLGTDYTVSGAGSASGGVVTPLNSETGNTITITRSVARTQNTDFNDLGAFPAEAAENALDRLTMLIQEALDVVRRSVVAPSGDTAVSLVLANATDRANRLLGFGGSGEVTSYPTGVSYVNEGAWETVASAATTNITGATSRNKNITGTTTITSFGTGSDGMTRFLRFAGALTINHNANIEGLNGTNMNIEAGDMAVVTWQNSKWRFIDYQRYTGQPFTAASITIFSGMMMGWPLSASPPTDWLICNGSAVSRTTYAALFAIIGTTYGAGDGSTTFNLPNTQDVFIYGYGGATALGRTAGNLTTASSAAGGHNHGGGVGTNTSYYVTNATGGASYNLAVGPHDHSIASVADHTHNVTLVPPKFGMNFIIKT